MTTDAPPAFLLDARRSGEGITPRPGQFDNRSVSSPSDFPSASRLRDAGIETILLVQADRSEPRLDLVRSLASWQDGGLRVVLLRTDLAGPVQPIRVRPPGVLARARLWWHQLTLRGDSRAGFGARVPEMPQGG